MGKKSLQQVLSENRQLGFGDQIIQIAYANVDGDGDRVLQEIFRLQEQSNKFPTKPSNPQDEDAQLSKAIQMSMTQAKDKKISLQPLNPQQRIRKSGVPVGLKNIGNTCYFNSILQTYFQNVNLVRTILNYHIPEKYKQKSDSAQQKINQEDVEFKRRQASCRLVQNLKDLFASLIASDRKYVDPTNVISSVVDDYGNQLTIGDQKDIGQFNLIFLSRIDQGLQLALKQSSMDIEQKGDEQNKQDSPSKIKLFGDQKLQQLSLLNRSSIKIQQNSLINQQFIGKMQNYFVNEKQNIHKQQQQLFSLLFINVVNGQLYKALQQITIQHIDDYRNEKGQVVGVQKQSWIKQAPKTLFFQIDRVLFNKQKSILQKINDQFDFPQTFYIDPFLLKNKEKALSVQKKVRQLRRDKQKYKSALKQFQKYGQKNLDIFDIFQSTTKFLSQQNSFMETQNQIDNPLYFSTLKSLIKPQHLKLLNTYKQNIKSRMQTYKKKVQLIDKQIQSCYATIRSTPYYLYSILIHEGSADSGHYYSYTYDIINKNWKKYNDINISEQVQNQVLKQARGINYTSAYYLVYAQQQVLCPVGVNKALRCNALSKQQNYLNDFYSQLVPKQVINKVRLQNQQLYLQIQQFKMGALANRVVDSYTKKFQTCNQIHRKTKVDKKKTNTPPVLINFPIYLKDGVNQQTYRNALMQNCIHEYGPKQPNPVFQDLVKKKMSNFNDFKKPKKMSIDSKFSQRFIHNVFRAQCAKKLFQILNNQQYNCLFSLMKQLRGGQRGDYFDWVSNLICKILVVRLLMQTEKQIKDPQLAIKRIQLLVTIMFNFINMDDEKILVNNSIQWIIQLSILLQGQNKVKLQNLCQFLQNRKYGGQYDHYLKSQENDPLEQIKKSTDYTDVMWNLSRTQNTFINAINDARQQVKNKMKVANQLYTQMKKQSLPLKAQQRKLIQQKAQK